MHKLTDWSLSKGLPIICLVIICVVFPGMIFFWKTHPGVTEKAASTEASALPGTSDPYLQLPDNSGPPPLPPGTPAVDFSSYTVDNKPYVFKSHSSNIKILEFWATWCGPCHMFIPSMEDMTKSYESEGVDVVGVAVDNSQTSSQVAPTVKQFGMNYTVLVDPKDNQNTALTYNATGLPSLYIIDGKGIVRWSFTGYWPDEEDYIRQIVSNLQAGKPAGLP